MARAQAALADAEAGLAAAQHVEAQTEIRAPIAGTIYSMDATPSEFSAAGNLLLQIADLSHERVRGYFDEPDLGRLATGEAVVIRWDAKPGMEWHGHVVRLPSAVVTYTTRNVGEVLIDFDGSADGLLPDTNVTLTVTTSSMPDTLSMPREALHEQNGKYFVFKVVNDELKRVPVTIGAPNLTQVPILSGLEEGDVVAIGTTNGQALAGGRADQGTTVMRSPAMVVALALTFLVWAGSTVSSAQISTATLAQANSDLQAGEADKAIALLTTLPSTGAGAAEAQNLLCRVRITLEQWSQAATECQQAVNS